MPRSFAVQFGAGEPFRKCVSCGETIRRHEQRTIVIRDDESRVRGECYCEHCEELAVINNDCVEYPDSDSGVFPDLNTWDAHVNADVHSLDDDDERHLRSREAYAEYQCSGSTEHYWTDRDAGYCD